MLSPASAAYRSVLLMLAVGAALLVALLLVDSGASATESSAATIACDASQQEYGILVSCAGDGGATLLWPDGTTTGSSASAAPRFVGDGEVALLDENGARLSGAQLRITPDVAIECLQRDDELRKVFELEQTDLRRQGWDYVFVDTSTGATIRPGDPAHPRGGSEDGLERVLLSEEYTTGLCRLRSIAADDLEGIHSASYSMVISSPWEAPQTTTMRIIGPSSRTQWAGTQPASLTGTVTINNVTASERTDVYQSGCS